MTPQLSDYTIWWWTTRRKRRLETYPDLWEIQESKLFKLFPELIGGPHECPVCKDDSLELGAMFIHLNDNHGWEREQIADWLETR